MQAQDPDLGLVMSWMNRAPSAGPIPGEVLAMSSPAARYYWHLRGQLFLQHGLLVRRRPLEDGQVHTQLVVPAEMRGHLLRAMHDNPLGGHLGRRKTLGKLWTTYWWFDMREDVKVYLRQCDTCVLSKRRQRPPKAPLGDMQTGAPMDRLSSDVLGPLPWSNSENRFIIVVTDNFTRWMEVTAIPDQTAPVTARAILDMICRFGCPLALHSDQGTNYMSHVVTELCSLLEVKKTRTSARRPQCNGQTERYNSTLLQMIRAYISDDQQDWDEHLHLLAAAYRAAVNETTGFTPNFMMLGREVRMPMEAQLDAGAGSESPAGPGMYGEYVAEVRDKMQHAHATVRKVLNAKFEHDQESRMTRKPLRVYTRGELVWHMDVYALPGEAPKLMPSYGGPYLVLGQFGKHDYLIQKAANSRPIVVHQDSLKLYEGTKTLTWRTAALRSKKVPA